MNSVIIKNLLKEYDNRQLQNVRDLEQKKSELYSRLPRLREIENELNSISISYAKSILQSNNSNLINELKEKTEKLKEERANILKQDGKEENYLSVSYKCPTCKDTGYVLNNASSEMCNCLKQKIFDLEFNKSNLNNLKKENFNNFNLNLYSDEVDEEKYGSLISPKENIKEIKKAALDFLKNIDNPEEKNLLFSGGTGLGKTFLSNCIVAEAMKKGKTVLYQTAPVMLDSVISDIFSNKNSTDSISHNLLNVDLLVIDDLGTETMNSMKFTELYKIINTRLLNQNGKVTKTIISTNLDLQSLFETYDERLVSRFVGHYNIYHFFGDDIRFKK